MKLSNAVAILLPIAWSWSPACAAGDCVKFKQFIATQIAEGTYTYKELTTKSSPDRIWTEEKCRIEVVTKLKDTISLGTFNANGHIACQAVYQVTETSTGRSYDIKSTPFAVIVSDSGKPLEALFAEVPIDDLRSVMKQQYRPAPFTIKLHNEGVGSFGRDLNCRAEFTPFPSVKTQPSPKQASTENQKLNSVAAQGQWTEGFGQGNLEYFIDQEGMRLYIGCPTKDGSADSQSSVSLSQLSDSKEIQKFTIDVNGISYDGPFSADSRVGDNNFLSLLENLRKADAVVKFGGKSIKMPKSNAANVIPAYGKKFRCNLSF